MAGTHELCSYIDLVNDRIANQDIGKSTWEKRTCVKKKEGGGGGGAFRRVVTAPASWDDRGSESGDGDESR